MQVVVPRPLCSIVGQLHTTHLAGDVREQAVHGLQLHEQLRGVVKGAAVTVKQCFLCKQPNVCRV